MRTYKLGTEFPYEGFVQNAVEQFFSARGFAIDVKSHVDLLCSHLAANERWHIEAKGMTSSPGLDFRTCLGQLVLQMQDADTCYGIALPDVPQFRAQIARTSARAVEMLAIHWLLVSPDGTVRMVCPSGSSSRCSHQTYDA